MYHPEAHDPPERFRPISIKLAEARKAHGRAFTNFLLGWTALGWIGAFIWALTANVKSAEAQAVKGAARGMDKFAVLEIMATLLLGVVFIIPS